MANKQLFIVHGRSTKPRREEKERLISAAMMHGLNRVSKDAAKAVKTSSIAVSFAYYGDISNSLLVAADPKLTKRMVLSDGVWYEKDGCYDQALKTLLQRATAAYTEDEYDKLIKNHPDQRFGDDLARVLSPILANGLSKRIITRFLPDLGAYVTSRKWGSAIRQRLQGPLEAILKKKNADIAIISHSMGCLAAYDILWKFSQMSEYEHFHSKKVTLWMTLGCPLGEPSIRQSLYDSNEPPDGLYPRNVRRWLNIAAKDDFVAHDGNVADDFAEMGRLGCEIIDLPRIYTFWVGDQGTNPHKLYGYLDHPTVAEALAEWITA